MRCGSPARIRRDPRRTCSGMPYGSCRISFWILGSFPDLQVNRVRFLCFLGHSVGLSVLADPRELGSWDPKTNALARSFFHLTRSVYRSISGGQYGGESVYVYAEIDFSGDLYARIHICFQIQNTSIPLIARLSGFSGAIPHSSQLFPKITFSE